LLPDARFSGWYDRTLLEPAIREHHDGRRCPRTLLVHNVYFALNDNSPENVQKLVAACRKYLTDHPGTVLFACGGVSDLNRSVNDRDWDVGLHLVFKNRAAHDVYQDAPRHLQFIEENKATWKKVRVFDSDCQSLSKG
jgi:hypothetical protein